MTRVIEVDSAADPRLADFAALTDSALRRSTEAEHGLFIAEGGTVIRRAVAAGYPVRALLVTRERLAGLAGLTAPGAPVYLVPGPVARDLTGYQVHRGALASLRRLPLPSAARVLAGARRVVVLEDIVDHANVGAVFRCAAALGVDAVLLAPRCADPLYRRAVKVSMGAVFAVPYARLADWYGGLAGLRAAGFRLLALTPDQSAVPIGSAAAGEREQERDRDRDRIALLLGTEGDGLSSRWLSQADEAVCIPMAPGAAAAGVDSLNVAAAAAVACYALGGA